MILYKLNSMLIHNPSRFYEIPHRPIIKPPKLKKSPSCTQERKIRRASHNPHISGILFPQKTKSLNFHYRRGSNKKKKKKKLRLALSNREKWSVNNPKLVSRPVRFYFRDQSARAPRASEYAGSPREAAARLRAVLYPGGRA